MILITGATGFVAKSLISVLDEEGKSWRPYIGRINDPLSLRSHLEGVDTVIHLAGAEKRGRNRLLQHVDVEGTERLIEECLRAQVQRLIVLSRIGAHPDSLHPLLRAKGEVERLVRKSGISHVILRSATLFGRRDRFTEIIVSLAIWNWPFVFVPGGGMTSMQPLWVEDLVRCLVIILDRPELAGKTLIVAGEERLHYGELLKLLLSTAGYRRSPIKVPFILLHPFSALLFGWWPIPPVTRYFVDRLFVPEVTESDSVLRQFGFRPARIADTIGYICRAGLRWRIFRS